MELLFIGAGKMGTAIASGLIKSKEFMPSELAAFDVSATAADNFHSITSINCYTNDLAGLISSAKAVLLAVKPQMLSSAVSGMRELLSSKTIISIVAGITIVRLEKLTGSSRIIRVMPNTPALVGAGAAACAVATGATPVDIALAEKIIGSVGMVMQVNEADLDAVTALSGSGPAYVFEFIQALADGGVAEGLSRDCATKLAIQTVLGAAQLAQQTGTHPIILKDMVTSPAGTTSRACEVLSKKGWAGTVIEAVRVATQRSRELGECK